VTFPQNEMILHHFMVAATNPDMTSDCKQLLVCLFVRYILLLNRAAAGYNINIFMTWFPQEVLVAVFTPGNEAVSEYTRYLREFVAVAGDRERANYQAIYNVVNPGHEIPVSESMEYGGIGEE
jgi:hypothetical protein